MKPIRFGAIERRRVGGMKLDWREVNRLTDKFMAQAVPCDMYNVRFPSGIAHDQTRVWHPLRATKVPVEVVLYRDAIAPGQPGATVKGTARQISRFVTKVNSRGKRRRRRVWLPGNIARGQVVITANTDVCARKADWYTRARSVIAHELTHIADPSRRRARKSLENVPYCEYINQPHEITANISNVRAELVTLRPDMVSILKAEIPFMRGRPASPVDLLRQTRAWRRIVKCLDEPTKRRFYQMAARYWK